jgi:hypothetical protein
MLIESFGQQVKSGNYSALQRNASNIRDVSRPVPKPLVVVAKVNGHPVRALVDSGSLSDFVSGALVQQLDLPKDELAKPLQVQMAAQGSRTKVNYGTKVSFSYQAIKEERYFDVMNLSNYDLILGTPFLYQHCVSLCLEPPAIVIGSEKSLPLKGPRIRILESRAADLYEENLQKVRNDLIQYAQPLCKSAIDTPLPPLRDINHEIPIIDHSRKYSWRPSRCPDALLDQWLDKKDRYIRTGRWKPMPASNAVPMLLLPKPRKPGEPLKLRTVVDLRERNANTKKLSSPLPDIDAILRKVAAAKYRSSIDLTDAYEQIRVRPEHVPLTAMTTPNGTMVSEVMQQGDCNASATFQMIMMSIFGPYIGDFLEIYLDDGFIFSETLENHAKQVKLVIDLLRKHKFYVSERKLHFLQKEMKILGRLIVNGGIQMDPDKVDVLCNWKAPTNRDLLRGFLGSAGYLADDMDRVRIPMGILSELTGDTVPFRWEYTHQRAFDDIKSKAVICKGHFRRPLRYGIEAPPINVVTDGCITGIAGVVSQGNDWRNATVAAFYSAKLNPAQQNYPVHEIGMLAGLETMMRHKDILQGAKFRWYTDHKGLINLYRQRDLSPRQARWMEKLSQFDFEIEYVPGSENILSDALSRLYSNETTGTVRSRSEYTYHDVVDEDGPQAPDVTRPVLVALEAKASLISSGRGRIHYRTGKRLEGASATRGVNTLEVATMDVRRSARLAGRDARCDSLPLEGQEGGSSQRSKTKKKQRYQSKETKENKRLTIKIPPQRKVTNTETGKAIPQQEDKVETTQQEQSSGGLNGHSQEEAPQNKTRSGDQNNGNGLEHNVTMPNPITMTLTSLQGTDVLQAIKGKYNEDDIFKVVIEKPNEHKNFVYKNQLLYIKLEDSEPLCIPDIMLDGRKLRELLILEAHTILAHLGSRKTLIHLRDHVWWKSMAKDTAAFCETCITCKRSKPNNHKPYGLLNPLKTPQRPWESIGIDFIGPLPESQNRNGKFDTITAVIDRLTGMVHLIPSRQTFKAREIAELVFSEIYRLHGLPKTIISDRDLLFNSIFWKRLHKLLGIKLHMSSAYHPESDGATERANRTITQMIRQSIDDKQTNWATKLPAVEFAINIARSEVTGYAPFFLNYGRMPQSLLWDSGQKDEFPGILKFAQNLKIAIMSAHDSILAHRVKEIRTANRKRLPSPFEIGDLVYILSKNLSIPKGFARKFYPKFVGPYPIIQSFNNDSFRIGISKSLKQRGIHDVFHASLLRLHIPNNDQLFPNRLDSVIWNTDDVAQEWSVSRIKSNSGTCQNALFEIEWKSGDITWLPYHQITHLTALQQYLEACGIENINQLTKDMFISEIGSEQLTLSSIEIVDVFNEANTVHCSQLPVPLFPLYLLITLFHFRVFFFTMPEVDWRPPRSLVNTLKTNFPFIYANEPALWTILDTTDPDHASKPPVFRHFSPALMRLYNQFDLRLRNNNFEGANEPIGYTSFAIIFNNHGNTPFGYTYWDNNVMQWIVPPNRRHISYSDLDLLGFALAIPPSKNNTLMDIGLADANGHTKDDVVVNMTRAIVSSVIRKENEIVSTMGYGPARSMGRNGTRRLKYMPYEKKARRYFETDDNNSDGFISVPSSPALTPFSNLPPSVATITSPISTSTSVASPSNITEHAGNTINPALLTPNGPGTGSNTMEEEFIAV